MQFTAEELFDIAKEEYAAAGLEATAEGAGNWAHYSADDEYADEDEVREELRGYIKEEKERTE